MRDTETEARLLDATDRLVRRLGMGKTSMGDVAREAGAARGTLYRYFESRDALFDALMLRTVDRFFADAAAAMAGLPALSEQIGEFAERTIRGMNPDSAVSNQAGMTRMMVTAGPQALRRTSGFLRPYIEAARGRGEVRADLDITDASEWLARSVLSFTVFHASVSFPADDPESVRKFVRRYAIHGLA